MPDQRHARLRQLRGDALQAADPLPRQRTDLLRHVLRNRRERIVLRNLEAHHPRRLGGAVSSRKPRAKSDGHLAKDRARVAPTEGALDAVEGLHDFDLAAEDSKERAFATLVHRELPGSKFKIGRCQRQARQFCRGQSREQRHCC